MPNPWELFDNPFGRQFMKAQISFIALLLVASFCPAQEHPTVTAQPNTVYVGADGKFESAPDTAVIQFNVSVQEDTSQVAYQHASREVEQVRQVMHANGVDPKNPKQKVIGYRVTTNVTLKLKDFSKIGPITQQLADANVSESQSLNYALEN